MNSPSTGPNLLILGVSSSLGQTVVSHLQRHNPFNRIVGIDRRAPRLLGPVQFCTPSVDLGSLIISNAIQVIMQLTFEEGSVRESLQETQKLVQLLPKTKVQRVVFLSTSRVYAPSEVPATELSPLRNPCKAHLLNAYLQAEQLYQNAVQACPQLEFVPIRACPILNVNRERPIDELLDMPWIIAPRKADPLVQFLHEDDAAHILITAARLPELSGPINAAGEEPIPLSTVAGILQKPLIHPFPFLAQPLCWLFQHLGVCHFSPEILRSLWNVGPISCDYLYQTIHLKPHYSTRQTLAVWRARYVEKRHPNWRLPPTPTLELYNAKSNDHD